jgi:hypothetical protein
VAASVPSSLRPTNAGWNKPQQDVGSVSGRSLLMALPRLQVATGNQSLTKIKDRLFGPGPADFVTRLGMIDQRMQEFKTRNAEGDGRVCVGEAAKQWTPNFLPSGVSFPMWFSCQEVMAGGSGLTVLFGKQGTTTYVGELQWPAANMNAPRMAVLAAVSNNGTQVEAWQIVTGTNMVSYLQIRADRTSQEVVVRASSLGSGTRAISNIGQRQLPECVGCKLAYRMLLEIHCAGLRLLFIRQMVCMPLVSPRSCRLPPRKAIKWTLAVVFASAAPRL